MLSADQTQNLARSILETGQYPLASWYFIRQRHCRLCLVRAFLFPETPANHPATEVPDSITLEEFVSNPKYGRRNLSQSRNPYTCGITGQTRTPDEVHQRTGHVARAIAKRLSFDPQDGTEWDRVVCLFSVNTVRYHLPVSMADL